MNGEKHKRLLGLEAGHNLELVIIELRAIFTNANIKYPNLCSLRTSISFHDIISCLLSISINGNVSASVATVMPWLFDRDDDPISVTWDIIETQLGLTAFNVLDWVAVDAELHSLLSEVDSVIGFYIPPDWEAAAFTFYNWLGNTSVVLLKDG